MRCVVSMRITTGKLELSCILGLHTSRAALLDYTDLIGPETRQSSDDFF